MKFRGYSSNGSRVVPHGRTDGRRDMTVVVVAFRNFVNAPNSVYRVSEKDCTLLNFYFLGAQCVESGVSCTDCY
jgi:FtsZ-interacting cell division protein YlmF